jgi:DNA-binding Lrp family transcriptional regulator
MKDKFYIDNKMPRGKILELEKRRQIYNFILKNPGLHMKKLSIELDIPKSTMEYHLNYLKKSGLIAATPKGNCTRYYVSNKYGAKEKQILNILREDVPRKILLLILLYPQYFSQKRLSEYLKVHPPAISYHINKFIELGVIDRFQMPNKGITFNNIKKPRNVYSKRFQNMFYLPDNPDINIRKQRKQIIYNLCKKDIITNDNANGHEILYIVLKPALIYEFLIMNQESLMDDEIVQILNWLEEYWGHLYDTVLDVVSEILPGVTTNFVI